MTPQDDSHGSIINDEHGYHANILAENLAEETICGLSENARKNGLSIKIEWEALSNENNPYRISEECLKDILATQNKEDKFMILLLFAIFQKHYAQCGIRDKIHSCMKTKNSSWVSLDELEGPHAYQPLVKLELTRGYEGDYYNAWSEPLFLEEDQDNGTPLGDTYVLPSYKRGRNIRNDLMDYMDHLIENENHKNQISLILGGPGSGKTTLFSRFLNYDAAENPHIRVNYEGDIPVFIYRGKKRVYLYRFNKISKEVWIGSDGQGEASVEKVEEGLFKMMGIKDVSELKDTILLLDGFDECPASKELRQSLLTQIADVWGTYARIFITCRFHYIRDTGNLGNKVSCISLQPFDWEHIRAFICKYKKWDAENDRNEGLLQKYWDVMGKGQEVEADTEDDLFNFQKYLDVMGKGQEVEADTEDDPSNIYGIPIILYMVLAMEDQIILNPDSTKGMIYDQIFRKDNGIYDRMIKDKYYDRISTVNQRFNLFLKDDAIRVAYKNRLIAVSHEIAHYMFRNDCYQNARKRSIEELYQEEFQPFLDSNGNEVDFSRLLSSGMFMIVDTPEKGSESDSTIRFVHKSMYEYFVAEYIFSKIKNYMENGSDQELHEGLVMLLQDRLISTEIGEYLEQKLEADQDMDFSRFESFSEKMLWLGIHAYPEKQIGTKEDREASLVDLEQERKKKSAQEQEVFENLIAILQLFRSAKGLKNEKNLLFANHPHAKNALPEYLRKGRYNGTTYDGFDLSYMDLSGMDLSHLDLSYYDFTGTNACQTSFRHSRLDFCTLTDMHLTDAAFTGAALWHTSPTANELFDNPKAKSPWTRFEGYLQRPYDLSKDPLFSKKGRFIGTYRLGKYPMQSESEQKDSILWDVLEVRDNRMLLLSQNILDVIPYNLRGVETNWKECSLNQWLKKEFLEKAEFTTEEKERFCKSLSEPHDNIGPELLVDQGEASIDEFFLLSGQELVRYCGSSESTNEYGIDWEKSKAEITPFVKDAGVWEHNGFGQWWLRSVVFSGRYAMDVYGDGDVYTSGSRVGLDCVGVRPALYIRLTKS